MKPDFTVHRTPAFCVLEKDQLQQIHLSVLEVLQRTGVDVRHEKVRQLLKKAGCRVAGSRVHFPGRLVERCIASAPSRVVIHDRDRRAAMYLQSTETYFGMGSDTVYVYEAGTGELKSSEAADVANAARVAHACPNIDYLMSLGIVHDVPQSVNDLVQFQQMVESSTKPICFTAHHRENLQAIIDMAAAVAGGLKALQANPFIIKRQRRLEAVEFGKDSVLLPSRDAHARVAKADDQMSPSALLSVLQGSLRSPDGKPATLRREPQRIVQEIVQDLSQSLRIAPGRTEIGG